MSGSPHRPRREFLDIDAEGPQPQDSVVAEFGPLLKPDNPKPSYVADGRQGQIHCVMTNGRPVLQLIVSDMYPP